MLNEDLMDPKDLKIARLELTIKKFKEYDEERKRYYKKAMVELGELKSYVAELEDIPDSVPGIYKGQIEHFKSKCERQREELRKLNLILESRFNTFRINSLKDDDGTLSLIKAMNEIKSLENEVTRLNKIIEELKKNGQ